MNPALLALLMEDGPKVVAFIQGLWAAKHSDQPMPTEAEIIAAWPAARDASLAKDDAFRAEG